MAQAGTVKKFFEEKGFGFIMPDDGSEDVLIHVKQVNGDGLKVGDLVTFDTAWNDHKGKMDGANCTVTGRCGTGGDVGANVFPDNDAMSKEPLYRVGGSFYTKPPKSKGGGKSKSSFSPYGWFWW